MTDFKVYSYIEIIQGRSGKDKLGKEVRDIKRTIVIIIITNLIFSNFAAV